MVEEEFDISKELEEIQEVQRDLNNRVTFIETRLNTIAGAWNEATREEDKG